MFFLCLALLHPIKSLAYGTFNCIMLHFSPLKTSQSQDYNCCLENHRLHFFEFSIVQPGFEPKISGFEFDRSIIELTHHYSYLKFLFEVFRKKPEIDWLRSSSNLFLIRPTLGKKRLEYQLAKLPDSGWERVPDVRWGGC